MSIISFAVKYIFNRLEYLNFHSFTGPDGISNILLQSYKHAFSIPVHKMFNRCLQV